LVYPKSVSTVASDVNSTGEISGSWGNTGPNNQGHGFLLTSAANGRYSDVDYPGAVVTLIFGINDLDQVVGSYIDAASVTHGWVGLPAKKEYITLDFPGSISSNLGGITKGDVVVGWYTDSLGKTHGYCVISKGPNTELPDRVEGPTVPPPGKGHCPG
jgi:hypothetical protein